MWSRARQHGVSLAPPRSFSLLSLADADTPRALRLARRSLACSLSPRGDERKEWTVPWHHVHDRDRDRRSATRNRKATTTEVNE